jgi:hypothetical protein
MSGTTMSVSDRYAEPDDVGEPIDPLIDSLYEDVAAVARGLVEIRRLVEHLQAGLTDAR